MLSACPGCNHPTQRQVQKQRWICANERRRVAPLFVEIRVFPELRIAAGLFVAGYALNPVNGMRIKNIVVADPQFERETGTNRDDPVKLRVVAGAPGETTEEGQCQGQDRACPL